MAGFRHCRHYTYKRDGDWRKQIPDTGPTCAIGVDLKTEPGASKCCWPSPLARCEKREEVTDEERRNDAESKVDSTLRAVVVLGVIPGDGSSGQLKCPACENGMVRWSRARSNGHLHAACTTPKCFAIMQ